MADPIPDFTFDLVSGPTMTFVSGSISASAYLTSTGRLGFGLDTSTPSVDFAAMAQTASHIDSRNVDVWSSGSSNKDGTDVGGILISDHFLCAVIGSLRNFATSVSGTGAVLGPAAGQVGHPGILSFTTGTTVAARLSIFSYATSIVFGSGTYTTEACINIPTLSDATNRYVLYVGFGDTFGSVGDNADGAYFQYSDSGSLNWQIKTANAGVRTTVITSNVVSVGWVRLKVAVVNTTANFYINDIFVGTISTNVPSATGRECGIYVKLEKTLGTTARTLLLDYFKLSYT